MHAMNAHTEANLIAYELMMPEADIRLFMKQGCTIESLADIFGVPQSVVTFRLIHLGYNIR